MPRNPAMEPQGRSSSVLHVACHCAMLVAVLCAPMCAWAYDVKYTVVTSPSGFDPYNAGYCPYSGGGHMMMPMKESFQKVAAENIKAAGFNEAPIGGWNTHVTCTTEPCEWIFTAGLMNGSSIEKATFFKGVVHNGVDNTQPVDGMYNNFKRGEQPVSYRQANAGNMISMNGDGSWKNRARGVLFRNWICEYYEFTEEEKATAPATDEFGFIIKKESVFPWWGGLLIALGAGIIVLAAIGVFCFFRSKKLPDDDAIETMQIRESYAQDPLRMQMVLSHQASMASVFADDGGVYADGLQSGLGPMGTGHFASGYADNPFVGGGLCEESFVGGGNNYSQTIPVESDAPHQAA